MICQNTPLILSLLSRHANLCLTILWVSLLEMKSSLHFHQQGESIQVEWTAPVNHSRKDWIGVSYDFSSDVTI